MRSNGTGRGLPICQGCQDHGYLHELDANGKHPPCPDCGSTGYEFSPCKTCYGCGAVHQPVGPTDTDIRPDWTYLLTGETLHYKGD